MTSIRLELMGGFRLRLPGGEAHSLSSKKGRALLAVLALEPRTQSREMLCGLLWSTRERAHAYSSLRHELVSLKRAFDGHLESALAIEGDTVALVADVVETDVAEFERLAQENRAVSLQRAASLHKGPLLDGLAVQDPAFEEWLARERDRLNEALISVLERLSRSLSGEAAILTAKRLLALDSLREASYRTIMQVYAGNGQIDSALRQYESCREILRRELAVEPAKETRQLRDRIASEGIAPPRAGPGTDPTADEAGHEAFLVKSLLLIQPFQTLGDDKELVALGMGLADGVAAALLRFRLISIVRRAVPLAAASRQQDLRQLAQETGASYVLFGSLRRSGDRVRTMVNLIETSLGRELWAERFDRTLTDAFGLEDELTQAIAAGIEHVIVSAEHRRNLERLPGDKRESHQAGWHLFKFTREHNGEAIRLLRQAIVSSPHADRRQQALSLAIGLNLIFGWAEQPQASIDEMLSVAERAVALVEQDAWNYAPLCWALMFARQFERAIAATVRMIELNPNSGVSFGVSTIVHGHGGDAETALELLAQAQRMAPRAPFMFNYLCGGALALYRLERFVEAAEMAEAAGLRRPNYFQPQILLAAASARSGQRSRAVAALAAARRLAPPLSESWMQPLMPIKDEADFVNVLTGLRQVGWDG